MSDLMKIGSNWGGSGSFTPLTAGISGAQRVQDAHARYMDALLAGRAYSLSLSAAAGSAFTGGAGGTPLIALYNPANSNRVFIPLFAMFAQRAAATAAGIIAASIWAGPSALVTGTKTPPTNLLSLQAAGSAALGFVNTALTGSTALTNQFPLLTRSVGAAAAEGGLPGLIDLAGIPAVAPGNLAALGQALAGPATYTGDWALIWEEVPALATV
jgi:hypothetical protein